MASVAVAHNVMQVGHPAHPHNDTPLEDHKKCAYCGGQGDDQKPLFVPCLCPVFMHQECLIKKIARNKKKRCEECDALYEFVPVSSQQGSKVRFDVYRKQFQEFLKVAIGLVAFIIVLPLSCFLSSHPLSTDYHWIPKTLMVYALGFIELLLFDFVSDCVNELSARKPQKRQELKSSLPVTPTSSWLAKVSPREYRAYLHRRELWREQRGDKPDCEDMELIDGNIGDNNADDDTKSSSAKSLLTKKLQQQSPNCNSLPVSIREPIRCKVCQKRTCIDKEHVIAASQGSPAPSVVSQATNAPSVFKGRYHASGDSGSGDKRSSSAFMIIVYHQVIVLMSFTLPLLIGQYILQTGDNFMREMVNVAVNIMNYVRPGMFPLSPDIGFPIDSLIQRTGLGVYFSAYIFGSLSVYALMRTMQKVKFCRLYVQCFHDFAKIILEFAVLPWLVSPRDLIKGLLITKYVSETFNKAKAGTRPGLLPDLAVIDMKRQSIGQLLSDGFTNQIIRFIPYIVIGRVSDYWLNDFDLDFIFLGAILHFFNDQLQTLIDIQHVARHMARKLRLSSIVYGERAPIEEQYPYGGSYRFAPVTRRSWSRIWQAYKIPVEPIDIAVRNECKLKGFTVVYEPHFWIARMAVLSFGLFAIFVVEKGLLLLVPYYTADYLFALTDIHVNNLYKWVFGYALLKGLYSCVEQIIKHWGLIKRLLNQASKWTRSFIIHFVAIPLSLSVCSEHFITMMNHGGQISTVFTLWMRGLALWGFIYSVINGTVDAHVNYTRLALALALVSSTPFVIKHAFHTQDIIIVDPHITTYLLAIILFLLKETINKAKH